MKVLHLNAGNETGGGMVHILSLLNQLNREEFYLGLLENGTFEMKAKEMGINTFVFEQSSRYDFSILSKIIRFIKQERIDILHTHGARANLYGYFIKMSTKVKWVTTVHSDPRNDFLGRGIIGKIFTKMNLMVIKKPDYLFAISERFAAMMSGLGVNSNKITTIFNGIDFNKKTTQIIPREDLKLFQTDFVILMVARFDPVKRHELALQALENVLRSHPNVKMLFVGDGQTMGAIKAFVSKLGLNQNVMFLGQQGNVAPYYKIADVTLLTSKTESFPLVLLESAREKTPVITTDVGGVQMMIPDCTYSTILKTDAVDDIANGIIQAIELKSSGKLEEMGGKFHDYTSQNFSIEAFADSVYKGYKGFLS
jgi:L-malate glycosyltransferase